MATKSKSKSKSKLPEFGCNRSELIGLAHIAMLRRGQTPVGLGSFTADADLWFAKLIEFAIRQGEIDETGKPL